MLTSSPSEAACSELIRTFDGLQIESGFCDSVDQLRQLWEIDKEAYQDHSLEFEPFLAWWERYPMGSQCLFSKGKIIASVGIYPLSCEQGTAFVSGAIREEDLKPATISEAASGISDWYFSGLVIIPEFQNMGLVRRIIRVGVGAWLSSGHVRYPLNLFGLGQTPKGKKALSLFGLLRLVEGATLPDQLDLYCARFETPAAIRLQLRGW